jgi:excisionase family DNA binding protein
MTPEQILSIQADIMVGLRAARQVVETLEHALAYTETMLKAGDAPHPTAAVSSQPNGETPEEFLTVADAARWLRVDKRTIYRYTKRGLPYIRTPGRLYLTRSAVDAWMQREVKIRHRDDVNDGEPKS